MTEKKDASKSMFKSLPGVDRVLALPEVLDMASGLDRRIIADLARHLVADLREEIKKGNSFELDADGKIASRMIVMRLTSMLKELKTPSLKRVVNATGIILHTNLGRAPLGQRVICALEGVAGSYTNLEFDLERGERGSRNVHLARLIRIVTSAEAGIAVNNNAAAVLLVLNTLASGREVVVSRGELIEIGGSFRIPEIIGRGFARLREVGTTNKTKLSDYADAIGPETALLLKVHTSNYRIVGFTQSVSLAELVELGRERGIPVMEDLGSGLMMNLSGTPLSGEPTVAESIEAGADVVTFSGDKLLGGPQAGIIAGKRDIVERVKKNPLMRAMRLDKLTIAAIEETLRTYLDPASLAESNVVARLINRKIEELDSIARELEQSISQAMPGAKVRIDSDESYTGGGSLPQQSLPTRVLVIEAPGMQASELALAFRKSRVPVIGRIRKGEFCLDARTILPGDVEDIAEAAAKIAGPDKED